MAEQTNPPDLSDPTGLLDRLPGAVVVLDGTGTIRFASTPAAEAIGCAAADLVGRSVLEFVVAESAWAYASAVAMAADYPDTVMGPLRIRLIDADGHERKADVWATNHLDDPAVGGVVCFFTEESAASGMTDAVTAVALGHRDDALGLVLDAMRGHPVTAEAALVLPSGPGPEPAGGTALPDELRGAGAEPSPGPWAGALAGARTLHEDLGSLEPELRKAAADAGFAAVWAEPVRTAGRPEPAAALVLWRRRPGRPSPNELAVLFEAAALAGLALVAE
jgi:hypothetical protein